MRPIDGVLQALKVVDGPDVGGEYVAFCCAHNDRNRPNLRVREAGDGSVLFHCNAGCDQEQVLEGLQQRGVRRSELFVGRDNVQRDSDRAFSAEPSRVWEVRDAEGEVQAVHVRYDRDGGGKRCFWRLPGSDQWGLGGRRSGTLPLYNSDDVKNWSEDLPFVVVAEGEPATDALLAAGFAAVGSVTGAGGTPGPEALEVLRSKTVVLWPDNDEPGRSHMRRVAEALRGVATEVRIFEWTEAPAGGDAADHPAIRSRSRGDIDKLREEMMRAPVWEPVVVGASEATTRATADGGSARARETWPVLADGALHGLAGEIVRAVDPHTEADRMAVLVNLLAAFGNAVGRGAYFQVGADRHHLNLFAALVGETGKGRKGMSWGPIRDLMSAVDPFWEEDRVSHGLSSGEGLIHTVRDPVLGTDKNGDPIVLDEGVKDKRLFVLESEFASVLKVMSRDGNTLSPIIRLAWDGGKLQTMTKTSPAKATDAHVSLVGHITAEELRRYLGKTEAANGFANRFLFLLVRRSKRLPFGGDWRRVDVAPLVRRLRAALNFGREVRRIRWGATAQEAWADVYGPLSEGRPGLSGAVTGRAEAQAVRLAALYAVLDESSSVEIEHLEASLAVWRYAEASARRIFGDATGDELADRITDELGRRPAGMTRNQIRDLFSRHRSSGEIGRALDALETSGRARRASEDTGGRRAERWYAAG